jgi:hypothetical protein
MPPRIIATVLTPIIVAVLPPKLAVAVNAAAAVLPVVAVDGRPPKAVIPGLLLRTVIAAKTLR